MRKRPRMPVSYQRVRRGHCKAKLSDCIPKAAEEDGGAPRATLDPMRQRPTEDTGGLERTRQNTSHALAARRYGVRIASWVGT